MRLDAGVGVLTPCRSSGRFCCSSGQIRRPAGGRHRGRPMSGDTLSDLLRAVRLRGAFFFYVEGADPWVVETSHSRDLIPLILPGVEHLIEFHGIASGSCWAAIVGGEPIRLNEGDVILFPQGDAHTMSSAPGMRAKVVDGGLRFTPRPPQLPYTLNVCDEGSATARLDGGGREQSKVVCGLL